MTGIFLVVSPAFNKIKIGDVIGLLSGVASALAVCTLKEARKHDNTFIILFYMMGVGAILNFILIIPNFIIPHGMVAVNLFASALLGILGQVFITSGYKHVTAKSGSLVSSSRIIFAVLLGVFIFSDPLTVKIIAGGLMILASIISVTLIQNRIIKKNEAIEIPEN